METVPGIPALGPPCRRRRSALGTWPLSGVFYIGLGNRFDGDRVKAYPPGSVIVLPGDTWHFHWAKSGEYITQVSAIGPLGLEYLDPADDPRQQDRT